MRYQGEWSIAAGPLIAQLGKNGVKVVRNGIGDRFTHVINRAHVD
jgi:hypothetical protein